MSRYLLSKKIWVSVAISGSLFVLLTYTWFYHLNQWAAQEERIALKEIQLIFMMERVAEAADQVLQPIAQPAASTEVTLTFPCIMKMKEGKIGLYNEEGVLCQELKQISEYLGDQDRIQLIQGIQANNQQELVLLCESYHLQ